VSTLTVEDLLAAIERLTPMLRAQALAAEDAGRLPDGVVAALREASILRMYRPVALGGTGAGLTGALRVAEALAEADPATAWVGTVAAAHAGFVGAYAGEAAVAEVLGGPDPVVAGQMGPVGRARRVEGGLVVSGRWSFASGIDHAAWVLAGAIVDAPAGTSAEARDHARPVAVEVVAPIERVQVDPASWDVSGLVATGSRDYRMDDVFVPDGYHFAFPRPTRLRGEPSFDLPTRAQALILHGGFPLGVARRAVAEAVGVATAKTRPLAEGAVADRGGFRRDLGRHLTNLAAARALVFDVARRLDDVAAAGRPADAALQADALAAGRHATDAAIDVATWAFRSAGGTALARRAPLQQLLRDLLAAGQHALVDDAVYDQVAALRLDR
jgi:alkylation response protein AidB-like acyl-CoA dehydrogenase